MSGGRDGMTLVRPAKTGPLFMICRAMFHGEESYPSSRIERKVSCKLLLGTRESR